MLNTFKNERPIRYFIIYLITGTLLGVLLGLATMGTHLEYFGVFTYTMLVWHLITALGMVSKYKWGFYLFKLYLWTLYIGFPIGTYVAKKYFVYIKEHEIERYYE